MRATAIGAYAAIVILLLAAAAAATQIRYGSLHPCDWLQVDAGRQSSLPETIVRTRIRAQFLLRGIVNPGAGDCLSAWWRVRRDGLPEEGATR